MSATITSPPALDTEFWRVACASVAERDELLSYARQAGAPVHDESYRYPDLYLEWWFDGLWSDEYPAAPEDEVTYLTAADFRAMCDAYRAR